MLPLVNSLLPDGSEPTQRSSHWHLIGTFKSWHWCKKCTSLKHLDWSWHVVTTCFRMKWANHTSPDANRAVPLSKCLNRLNPPATCQYNLFDSSEVKSTTQPLLAFYNQDYIIVRLNGDMCKWHLCQKRGKDENRTSASQKQSCPLSFSAICQVAISNKCVF